MTNKDKTLTQSIKELVRQTWGKPECRNLITDLNQLSTKTIVELSLNASEDARIQAMVIHLIHSSDTIEELQEVKALTRGKYPKPTPHYKELALTALHLASLHPTIEELAAVQNRVHKYLKKENRQD